MSRGGVRRWPFQVIPNIKGPVDGPGTIAPDGGVKDMKPETQAADRNPFPGGQSDSAGNGTKSSSASA